MFPDNYTCPGIVIAILENSGANLDICDLVIAFAVL